MFGYFKNLHRNFKADRKAPPLDYLSLLSRPEDLLREILPYVSRTFSLYINLNPPDLRVPLGIGYAYCRCLDYFEDAPGLSEAQRWQGLEGLRGWIEEGRGEALPEAQALAEATAPEDPEDRATRLLIKKLPIVGEMARRLPDPYQQTLRELVGAMSRGMQWNIRTLAAQQGHLHDRPQTERYCLHVAGVVGEFIDRLVCFRNFGEIRISDSRRDLNHRLGRCLQLTNIARDLEEDLANGRVYDYRLHQGLAVPGADRDQVLARVRGEINAEIDALFPELDSFLAYHRHGRFSRARGALLFPFVLAYLLSLAERDPGLREYYLFTGKKMVRQALWQSARAMLHPRWSRYQEWSRRLRTPY